MKYLYTFIILISVSMVSAAGLGNIFNDLKKPVQQPHPTPQPPQAPKPPQPPVKK